MHISNLQNTLGTLGFALLPKLKSRTFTSRRIYFHITKYQHFAQLLQSKAYIYGCHISELTLLCKYMCTVDHCKIYPWISSHQMGRPSFKNHYFDARTNPGKKHFLRSVNIFQSNPSSLVSSEYISAT